MIQKGTVLSISDNTGIKKVKCIKIFGTSNPRYAKLGDIVLIAISNKDVIRKYSNVNIKLSLLINTKKFTKRLNGIYIGFDKTKSIIINRNYSFTGTRIYHIVTKDIRKHSITNLQKYAKGYI